MNKSEMLITLTRQNFFTHDLNNTLPFSNTPTMSKTFRIAHRNYILSKSTYPVLLNYVYKRIIYNLTS